MKPSFEEPCLPIASGLPETSLYPDTSLQNDNKSRHKVHEEDIILEDKGKEIEANPDIKLDLGRSSKLFIHESSAELNFVDFLDISDSPTSSEASQAFNDEPRVFSCNYCQRKFYSAQALGGHQNAHKKERALAKKGQSLGTYMMTSSPAFAHPYLQPYHYSRMAYFPPQGHSTRNLEIQAHSLTHKPYKGLSWSNPFVEQQSGIGKLGSKYGQGNITGEFHMTRTKMSFSPDKSRGAYCWSEGGVRKKNEETKELDLSLKL